MDRQELMGKLTYALISFLLLFFLIACTLPNVGWIDNPSRVYDNNGKLQYTIEHSQNAQRIYDKNHKYKGQLEN